MLQRYLCSTTHLIKQFMVSLPYQDSSLFQISQKNFDVKNFFRGLKIQKNERERREVFGVCKISVNDSEYYITYVQYDSKIMVCVRNDHGRR